MGGRFQSSPVPEDGCNDTEVCLACDLRVSILTRPGGRVQRNYYPDTGIDETDVSILTRPGGRVQRDIGQDSRCTHTVSILTRPGGRVQPFDVVSGGGQPICFNPHPSRRTGATMARRAYYPSELVSILTRPGGRVQRCSLREACSR